MEQDSFYEILGLPIDAPVPEVRQAYIILSKKWHPDKNPGNETLATEKFKKINEAYSRILESHTDEQGIPWNEQVCKHPDLTQVYLNSSCVYIDAHRSLIKLWLQVCKTHYSQATPIDRGVQGVQLKLLTGEHDIPGSLSITVYQSTGAIHIQCDCAFLWLEETFPQLLKIVQSTPEYRNCKKTKKNQTKRNKSKKTMSEKIMPSMQGHR